MIITFYRLSNNDALSSGHVAAAVTPKSKADPSLVMYGSVTCISDTFPKNLFIAVRISKSYSLK